MKSLIIAEKPSLAKNIISAIGHHSFQKQDGYFESSDYIVSWAFGHLFSLLDLEDYKVKDVRQEDRRWTLEGLPFYPKPFRFALRKDPKTHKTDPHIRKQFIVLKTLCTREDVRYIIHAGDADREGEIIVRIILDQANNRKPIMRLWMPDQTAETIRAELHTLRKDSDYDALANEGYARTYIDWLYGINLTRLATVKSGTLLRVGRVIVPIVKAVYDRDLEIRNFTPQKYLALRSAAETNGQVIDLQSKKTFILSQREDAQALARTYNQAGAVVSAVDTEEKILGAGKLYSLSKLQGVLGKKYGMSPKQSLAVLQNLYEAGYVTYPRTNSEYLAEAERGKFNSILANLRNAGYHVSAKDKSTAIYNDSKIESHSALTPTSKMPDQTSLKLEEWQVYSTILNRFLAVFCSEECKVSRTSIQIQVGDFETFQLRGDILLSKGWLQYDDTGKSDKILPALAVGDRVQIDFQPVEKETKPPKHYTVDSLNNYLKNPFRQEKQELMDRTSDDEDDNAVSDQEEYQAIFDGVELGTEATRTSIIETAIRSKYIDLKRNTYTILPAGEYLIESLDQLQIQMGKEKTAELGRALKRVYRGESSIQEAVALAEREVRHYFTTAADITLSRVGQSGQSGEVIGKCPKCGGNVIERPKLYGCSNRECRFALWKEDNFMINIGKKMTKTMAKNLLSKGKVSLKNCISKKTGKSFDCVVLADFSEKYPKYQMRFPEKKGSKRTDT